MRFSAQPLNAQALLLALGLAAMYVPTYIELDRVIWGTVGQGHGPVMLALACWLAYQRIDTLRQTPREPAILPGLACFLVGLSCYFVGRSQDILLLDVGSQIFCLSALLLLYWGHAGWRAMWFPLFFLIFLLPLPSPVVDALTSPLKMAVSYVSEQILYLAGYPIARTGVTLSVGPYKLLVADACAGLNSVFALEAIGVFYMSFVGHTNKTRNILLATLILPISFVTNVLRVCVLVLVTYYFGDAVGQGFVHDFAGIFLFMMATFLTVTADSLLGIFFKDQQTAPSSTATQPQKA